MVMIQEITDPSKIIDHDTDAESIFNYLDTATESIDPSLKGYIENLTRRIVKGDVMTKQIASATKRLIESKPLCSNLREGKITKEFTALIRALGPDIVPSFSLALACVCSDTTDGLLLVSRLIMANQGSVLEGVQTLTLNMYLDHLFSLLFLDEESLKRDYLHIHNQLLTLLNNSELEKYWASLIEAQCQKNVNSPVIGAMSCLAKRPSFNILAGQYDIRKTVEDFVMRAENCRQFVYGWYCEVYKQILAHKGIDQETLIKRFEDSEEPEYVKFRCDVLISNYLNAPSEGLGYLETIPTPVLIDTASSDAIIQLSSYSEFKLKLLGLPSYPSLDANLENEFEKLKDIRRPCLNESDAITIWVLNLLEVASTSCMSSLIARFIEDPLCLLQLLFNLCRSQTDKGFMSLGENDPDFTLEQLAQLEVLMSQHYDKTNKNLSTLPLALVIRRAIIEQDQFNSVLGTLHKISSGIESFKMVNFVYHYLCSYTKALPILYQRGSVTHAFAMAEHLMNAHKVVSLNIKRSPDCIIADLLQFACRCCLPIDPKLIPYSASMRIAKGARLLCEQDALVGVLDGLKILINLTSCYDDICTFVADKMFSDLLSLTDTENDEVITLACELCCNISSKDAAIDCIMLKLDTSNIMVPIVMAGSIEDERLSKACCGFLLHVTEEPVICHKLIKLNFTINNEARTFVEVMISSLEGHLKAGNVLQLQMVCRILIHLLIHCFSAHPEFTKEVRHLVLAIAFVYVRLPVEHQALFLLIKGNVENRLFATYIESIRMPPHLEAIWRRLFV